MLQGTEERRKGRKIYHKFSVTLHLNKIKAVRLAFAQGLTGVRRNMLPEKCRVFNCIWWVISIIIDILANVTATKLLVLRISSLGPLKRSLHHASGLNTNWLQGRLFFQRQYDIRKYRGPKTWFLFFRNFSKRWTQVPVFSFDTPFSFPTSARTEGGADTFSL